jgi:hypothetical protein
MTHQETARAILDFYGGDHRRWCTGVMARSRSGIEAHQTSPTACSWCIHGALLASCQGQDWSAFTEAFFRNTRGGFATFNDASGRTFAELVAKLEEIANG